MKCEWLYKPSYNWGGTTLYCLVEDKFQYWLQVCLGVEYLQWIMEEEFGMVSHLSSLENPKPPFSFEGFLLPSVNLI